ncbi:dynamin family protein, partial [Paenibacillus sp. IB182496]
MHTTLQGAATDTSAALLELSRQLEREGDGAHGHKLRELADKREADRLTLAFCGHFSAGKSTLVNRLCGHPLLPSSPIPTSANVVAIRSGSPLARITRSTGETIEAPPEELERYCVDGASFASVEITYPMPHLGERTVLLDTPGIDSTDDAHQAATESALHLADVVFYVMDYNHVQSEINFAFAKRLKDWGKPLYLIVNQIDKHRERELSFADYRRSVEQAFASWHLEPAGILYVSMREPEHPHQQWQALQRLLRELQGVGGDLNASSVDASARHLIAEHGRWRSAREQERREQLLARAGGEEGAREALARLGAIDAELQEQQEAAETLRLRLRKEAQSLLDNAIIIPAATRDLAHAFLESRRSGFRAGLLFAAAKTAAERERRMQALLEDFGAQVDASIRWHLTELLRQAAHALGWQDESLERELSQALEAIVTEALLEDQVQPGAVFGNESTMNYCKALSASVKSDYRQRAYALIEQLTEPAAAPSSAAAEQLRQRRADVAAAAQAASA